MNLVIHVVVNGVPVVQATQQPVPIKETDRIKFTIVMDGVIDTPPDLFVEDYQIELSPADAVGSMVSWESAEHYYFAECFGYSVVRVEWSTGREILNFDVHARKTSVEQARKMIRYLASQSETLVHTCFARSSHSVGSIRSDSVEPEMLISSAENFITILSGSRSELLSGLRRRLVPKRVALWETDRVNPEVDPSDVLANLDALTPSGKGGGEVFIKGRHYELGNIHVTKVLPIADVAENRILLGGLYSIRRQLTQLIDRLSQFESDDVELEGYECFSRLLLSLTVGGMIKRCRSVLSDVTEYIRMFEQTLEVRFFGELPPVMSAYVRTTRSYRALFVSLSLWYDLGVPSMNGVNFLMKLRSLSKIYELYVLFHMLEELVVDNWAINSAQPHLSLGQNVPQSVELEKSSCKVVLHYEHVIPVLSDSTSAMDLVDVKHRATDRFPYWMPDFVLKISCGTEVRYVIFDAKYSTRAKVKSMHLPAIFEKYYVNIGVLDQRRQYITSEPILGVVAVYALDNDTGSYYSKWGERSLVKHPIRLPLVGAVGLMTDNSDAFRKFFLTALNIAVGTVKPKVEVSQPENIV